VGRHEALGDLREVLADTAQVIADQSKPLDQLKTSTRGTAATIAARLPDVGALVNKLIAVALHTGQFRAFGDVTLGVGGSLIVDFTLEILGNWYRHATERQPPAQVIAHLARRRRDLVEATRTHPEPLSDLDIARLTSPTQATPRGSAAPPSPGTRAQRVE
jgi:hypothetical protein